jgi:hypothetical protein
MGVGWAAQQKSVQDLTSRHNRMKEHAALILSQLDTGDQLRAELKLLENGGRLLDGLRLQSPPTRWLTAVAGALPEQTTLSEIHSEIDDDPAAAVRLAPAPGIKPELPSPAEAVQADLNRLALLAPRQSLTISLRGTATDDLEVSRFLTALNQTGLFERTQLLFTDQQTVGNSSLRAFAIRLRTRSMTRPRRPHPPAAPVATAPQAADSPAKN